MLKPRLAKRIHSLDEIKNSIIGNGLEIKIFYAFEVYTRLKLEE